jgi:protein-tyrosine phosphatase
VSGGAVRPFRVCLVCTGNICRSPMAEVVLRQRLAEAGLDEGRVEVESAGTGSWHAGEGMNPPAAAALGRRGYRSDGHVARRFEAGWLDRLDLVVALDRTHLRALEAAARHGGTAEIRLLRPGAEVPDPYGGPPGEFEDCLTMIETACASLAEEIARRVKAPPPGAPVA